MRHAFEFNEPPDEVYKELLEEYGHENVASVLPKPRPGESYRVVPMSDGRVAIIQD